MKLLSAEFQNFRLLRNLKLKFAGDVNRNLTVIRAANESGKTTILYALQWALYGDAALPGKGEGFRLHPIDWDEGESKRVPIIASVEFEGEDLPACVRQLARNAAAVPPRPFHLRGYE